MYGIAIIVFLQKTVDVHSKHVAVLELAFNLFGTGSYIREGVVRIPVFFGTVIVSRSVKDVQADFLANLAKHCGGVEGREFVEQEVYRLRL